MLYQSTPYQPTDHGGDKTVPARKRENIEVSDFWIRPHSPHECVGSPSRPFFVHSPEKLSQIRNVKAGGLSRYFFGGSAAGSFPLHRDRGRLSGHPANFLSSSSSRIETPNSRALENFEPGSSPATT